MESDEQLIADTLAGDETAFNEIVRRYLKIVYNFLLPFTKDSFNAEDIAQETFIKAWKNLSRYNKEKGNFKAWLLTIARNTALDFLKKKKAVPLSFFEDAEGNNPFETINDEKPLPDEILEKKDIADKMEKVLKELPERFRSVLLLYYKEGFNLTEIAEILGRPVNTVKSWHRRGLAALENKLATSEQLLGFEAIKSGNEYMTNKRLNKKTAPKRMDLGYKRA